ncbi:hypothetical protein [Thalassospira marina]|uniref:Tetratricopeptide repeat protein n=1 Tax=Thalassospira marina TaxID=2048283 RepID=A0ABM6QH27_9PROT|nr:hypothetical protein [Thalassospira marina]AUG55900.1 hypothetical protein CSC3H3_24110 [Thalassospira marina]
MFERPEKSLVNLVDKLFAAASSGLMSGGQFKHRTPKGKPSKTALFELFTGDFKGKVASWRNASARKGTPLNQLHRTDELIAIFSANDAKLFDSQKPIVPARKKADFLEFAQFLNDNFANDKNKLVLGLNAYRASLVTAYTENKVRNGGGLEAGITGRDFDISGSNTSGTPNKDFGASVLMYARYLAATRRHQMVVELRNKLTHLFHLLGLNGEREKLGQLAEKSSAVLKDNASRAEVLIDDLGWAIHLQGRTDEAEENIKAALVMLESEAPTNLEGKVRNFRARSKANRHLAFLAENLNLRSFYLDKCREAFEQVQTEKSAIELYNVGIRCDEAQLYHAQAYLSARDLGVQAEGELPDNDIAARKIADKALTIVNRAIEIFEDIGDLERQVKALVLVERLYRATGQRVKAVDAGALREEALAKSGIDGGLGSIALQKPITV